MEQTPRNRRFENISLGRVLPKDRPKMAKAFDDIFDIKDIINLPEILKKAA